MSNQTKYSINTDVKFTPLELIDVGRLASECNDEWFNQSLTPVNDCVVRLGIVKGEFHWHKHDNEDELFYVVAGKLLVDVAENTIELIPQQGYMVPRGIMHRTRAAERTVILMIEGNGVTPTGN
jgi:mannose-6-phosphate isomerase-like protein (cupin superfamily)